MKYDPIYQGTPEIRDELLRVAVAIESLRNKFEVRTMPPDKPRVGDVFICDGVYWNPLGDGEMKPIWFDGTVWKAL
jgi:hypothetical protein